MVRRYGPLAGDIVWLAFDPQAGHEQAGHRPVAGAKPIGIQRQNRIDALLPDDLASEGLSVRGIDLR